LRKNEKSVSKTYFFDKKLKSIQLDPMKETADIDDTSNNFWGTFSEPPNSKYSNRTRKRARGAAAGMVNPMQAAGKKN
jgi:abortive infection bacteriophage resistance protein